MAQRERTRTLRSGRERHQSNQILRPALQALALRPVATSHEEAKRALDGLKSTQTFLAPAEVPLGHAATDIDEHDDGDSLSGNARAQIGPARPSQGADERHQRRGAQARASPASQPAA